MTYRDEDTWRQIIDVVNNGGSPEEIIALPVQSVE